VLEDKKRRGRGKREPFKEPRASPVRRAIDCPNAGMEYGSEKGVKVTSWQWGVCKLLGEKGEGGCPETCLEGKENAGSRYGRGWGKTLNFLKNLTKILEKNFGS